MLGVAPSGATIFIRELYEGTKSDKDIVNRRGILNKSLWDDNNSIMADRSFAIQNELAPLSIELNVPPIFDDKAQLTEAKVKQK